MKRLFLNLLIALAFISCSKREIVEPTLLSPTVSDISHTTAKVTCNVNAGTEKIGSISLQVKAESTKNYSGTYSSNPTIYNLDDLIPNTEYFVSFTITTESGKQFTSAEKSFCTLPIPLPELLEFKVEDIADISAKLTLRTSSDAKYPITKKGFYLSENEDFSTKTEIILEDAETIVANNLTPGTKYYVKAYAENDGGISCSEYKTFTTETLNGEWTYLFSSKPREYVVCAANGSKVYYGLGSKSGGEYHDWNSYDLSTNTYASLKTYNGLIPASVNSTITFSIDSAIYLVNPDCSVWKYDIESDTWERMSQFPGTGRYFAIGNTVGNYGLYGFGSSSNDLWKYSPDKDEWTNISIPDEILYQLRHYYISRMTSFVLDNTLYIIYAMHDTSSEGDSKTREPSWAYNLQTNTWSKIAPFPGTSYQDIVGFSIGNYGYIATGMENDGRDSYGSSETWEYNPEKDEWSRKADYPDKRYWASGTTVNSLGIVGCGKPGTFATSGDFYAFNPRRGASSK